MIVLNDLNVAYIVYTVSAGRVTASLALVVLASVVAVVFVPDAVVLVLVVVFSLGVIFG